MGFGDQSEASDSYGMCMCVWNWMVPHTHTCPSILFVVFFSIDSIEVKCAKIEQILHLLFAESFEFALRRGTIRGIDTLCTNLIEYFNSSPAELCEIELRPIQKSQFVCMIPSPKSSELYVHFRTSLKWCFFFYQRVRSIWYFIS